MSTVLGYAYSYTAGECTAFIADIDPWIPPDLGDAKNWLVNAAQRGLQTGNTPIAGAVAVLQPGAFGLNISPSGHVASVDSVNSDGTVTVTDMNWNFQPFKVTTHNIPQSSIAGYIYPPGSNVNSGSPNLAQGTIEAASSGAQDTSWSFGPFNQDTPLIGGIGDIVQAIGSIPGDIANIPKLVGDVVSGIETFILKSGEVVLGLVCIGIGVYVVMKQTETGATIAQNVKQTGAKVAAAAGAI
jgi:hypothetical protein